MAEPASPAGPSLDDRDERDLPRPAQTLVIGKGLARHTIDILEVLKEKTSGNLDPEEDQLLTRVLHDLHMRFVEAQKG